MEKTNKKRLIVLLFLIIVVIGLSIYIISDKLLNNREDDFTEKNKPDNEESQITFVFYAESEIYGFTNNGEYIKLTSGANVLYDTFDISDGLLYYFDSEGFLHNVSLLEYDKDTKLNVKVEKEVWDLNVDDHYAIIFGSENSEWFQEIYDLNDGSVETLSFISENKSYFLNHNYYFTDETTKYLSVYNVDSKKINQIIKDARIVTARNKYIVYEVDDNLYLYDLEEKKVKESIENNDLTYSVGDTDVFIENNALYYHSSDALYKSENGKNVLLNKFNIDNESDYSYALVRINSEKAIVSEFKLSRQNDKCDEGCPDLEEKYYYWNFKKGTLEETKDEFIYLNYCNDMVMYK